MRSRFFHSRREILRAVNEMRDASTGVRDGAAIEDQLTVLSVPCGIARDLFDVAESLWKESALYEHVRFIGIDLDQEALDLSWDLTHDHFDFDFRRADALLTDSLPKGVDVIVSLGFGEFLSDEVLRDFYRSCHASLKDGGRFITSAMNRDRISDYLARELAELHTQYRSTDHVTELLRSAGFANIRATRDDVGLQTLAVAEKGP